MDDNANTKMIVYTLKAMVDTLEKILECERKTLEALEVNRQLLEMIYKRLPDARPTV